MADYLPKNRSQMLMDWLKQATPDQWHKVADGWNWGSGEAPLRWIIEQPDCDKATAQLIFWRGEPSYYWGIASDLAGLQAARASSLDVYTMLTRIVEKWRAGEYSRAELSYDPGVDARARPADVERSATHPALMLDDSMLEPIVGRELEDGEYDEGIPFHIIRATL